MVGTSEAAIYGIAYTLAMMMTIITGAINSSFIPYTYQNIKRKHYKEIGSNANFILLLVAMGCAMAMAFGPELIKLFATEEYYDAIWVMPPVAASVFFMFLYPVTPVISRSFCMTYAPYFLACPGKGVQGENQDCATPMVFPLLFPAASQSPHKEKKAPCNHLSMIAWNFFIYWSASS